MSSGKSERLRDIALDEKAAQQELQRRTRRDFLIGGAAAVLGIGGYSWLRSRGQELGVPWPERRVLDLNERIAHGYLSDSHLAKTYSLKDVGKLRPNGDVGLRDDIDMDAWRLKVENAAAGTAPLTLTLNDVKSLPRVEMITKFCCIEGWSVVTQWAGARFIDFSGKFLAPGQRVPNFVYMATPDEEYYVGLDAKSALHPQTLLAYEMNGAELEDEHGAPLRLVIPVKYGVKNLKRIGLIRYTDEKPDDYWNQQGYDWFAGL